MKKNPVQRKHISNLKTIKKALKLNLIELDEALELIELIKFKERVKNILDWGKYYFSDKFDLPFCDEMHQYIVSIRDIPLTATLAPRGYAKTTIQCFLIPIYQALNEPEKYRHYMNIQSTSSKAIAINLSIKLEIETNELLLRDYGGLVNYEKWTEKQFVLKNGVIFTAIGSLESMRGKNYKNIRPDFIITDDLYDDSDIHNIDRINTKERWFWGAVYKSTAKRANGKKVCIHVQGTAINNKDLIHKLRDNSGWEYKKFRAIKNFDKKTVLWPEAESFEQLMQDRVDMGTVIFSREMQNECRDDETSIIKESWINTYDGKIPEEEDIKWIRLGIDPAIGQKHTNDFTGKAVIIKTGLSNYYIADVKNERLSFNQNLEDIYRLHKLYKFDLVLLEAISAFQGLGQEIRRASDIPLRMITKVKDKTSRLEAQSRKFENGKVFISEDIEKKLRENLIEQLINNNPNHDDIRDSVIIALESDDVGRLGIAAV